MSIKVSREEFEKRKVLQAGQREISTSSFNAIIGGLLVWGLLLNYLMVRFLTDPILRLVGNLHPLVFILLYFGLVLVGSFMIRNESPVTSVIGFHLIAVPVGVIVCVALKGYGQATIQQAVAMTGIITVAFTLLGITFPKFFLSLGRVLFFALIASIVVELFGALILRTHFSWISWVVVGIFSLYIGYDWARANTCAKTVDNAVDLAANLYLDIINIFLRLLEIIGDIKD
ncbi:MAG: US12 family protein [Clostridia bacterium]|nr:US12 family protein [Clostridia bacterium]MBR4458066.1 US12 family protein [Clostridia bacterium]